MKWYLLMINAHDLQRKLRGHVSEALTNDGISVQQILL